jgi:shikimate kinase
MGTGKTAIGSLIADRIGVEFIDSDEQIVQAANMSVPDSYWN